MNKLGFVLGIAAVATLAGCKDPDYKYANASNTQNEVKNVDTTVTVAPASAPKCMCLPGTKHTSPCMCGDPNCKCVVEVKPAAPVAPVVAPTKPVASAEPEYTIYVVQSGDYLAKISKKFNVTIDSIKKLNPSIKKDVVRIGQKLKIPGKVDVGEQNVAPAQSSVVKATKKSSATAAYTGATKEYIVRSGDTLGSIAYGNGINIRQLKALNGLTSDSLKVGQKLKIPAEKVEKKAASAKNSAPAKKAAAEKKTEAAAPKAAAPVKEEKKAEAAPVKEEKKAEAAPAEAAPAPAEEKKAETAPAPAATTTYVVQEGDDMTSVSIRWGVSAAEIRELNNLSENDQLVAGQIIKLPAEAQQ